MGADAVLPAELDFDVFSDPRQGSVADTIAPLFTYGCVLFRKFVDPDRLKQLESLINAAYEKNEGLHIHPPHFLNNGLMDFHEYLFDERHHRLLSRVFDGEYSVDHNTGSLRIDLDPALGEEGTWMPPLGVHVDACFHSFQFTANFWIPFQPCGRDRPSLGVVRANFDEVMEFCGFTGSPDVSQRVAQEDEDWNRFHYFHRRMSDLDDRAEEAIEAFHQQFSDRIWTPAYAVGDAMMLTNWTLHFTHATAEMAQRRSNLELRFTSDKSLECMRDLHSDGSPTR